MGPRRRPSFSVLAKDGKEEGTMVKQRFPVLIRGWRFTRATVFEPILLLRVLVSVRQYLHYVPLGVLDLLMGAFMTLRFTTTLCGLGAWGGEWLVETVQASTFRE
jgi:hypothetical protein